jgi:hypothetical protein
MLVYDGPQISTKVTVQGSEVQQGAGLVKVNKGKNPEPVNAYVQNNIIRIYSDECI